MVEEETDGGEISPEGGEDSAPFRAMIARAEAAEAKLATIEQEAADAEVVAQQQRSEALDEIVNALDIPNLKSDLLLWVEGPITEESVDAALKAKGLNFVTTDEDPVTEAPQPEAPTSEPQLVPVSKLGQQVADAASGQGNKDFEQQINEAQTPGEIIAANEAAGTTVSYT